MNPKHRMAFLALATGLALTTLALAQQNYQNFQKLPPRIGYVYPAGGTAGSTFTVTVGGQYLDGCNTVTISGDGVEATVVDHYKPLPLIKALALGREAKAIAQKTNRTESENKRLTDIRTQLRTFSRSGSPSIAETVTLKVTVAQNAEVGDRELRIGSATALSNPRLFSIGQLPEALKPTAKAVVQTFNIKEFKGRDAQQAAPQAPEMKIAIPTVINGQIIPGNVDHYRFLAKRGQHLVIASRARELIPYIPDAVPGWFQCALTLRDAHGGELVSKDSFRFHPDPVLYYEIPDDGEYVLEVKDALFRGRDDFVYRISIGETPFITSIYPLGGKAGTQTAIEVKGWNLPVNSVTQNQDCPPGVFSVFVNKDGWISNRLPFLVDRSPQCTEQEPNDDASHAQAVSLPMIINGRIDKPDDWDVFRIRGRAGEEIVAEVQARRLDSPVDSILKITDATGKQFAFNDDNEDKASGLNTHHADSYIRVKLPAAGDYYIYLGDTQQKGGSEYGYRLRLSPPQHDFELRVAPSSINARVGSSSAFTVYALRKDGYDGDITLTLKNAPEGYKLSGAAIPAGQERVPVTLSVPGTPGKEPVTITIEGRANVDGKVVVHEAVPADDMMQAFAYRHLVPAKQLKIAVSEKNIGTGAIKLTEIAPVKIPAGGTAKIHLGTSLTPSFGTLQLELSEPPDGITIKEFSTTRDGSEILLASEADKTKPGLKGNLIINAFTAFSGPKKESKGAAQSRIPIGTLPSIPFEVIGR